MFQILYTDELLYERVVTSRNNAGHHVRVRHPRNTIWISTQAQREVASKHVTWIEHAVTLDLIGAPSREMLEHALPKRTIVHPSYDIRPLHEKHLSEASPLSKRTRG